MKVNQCFLHGFMTGETVRVPLTIVGDENAITLTKGEGFDAWLADTTKIVLHDDTETTYTAQNQQVLNAIVRAWLHGKEFDG